MGGKALSCEAVRLTKEDYERLAAQVVERLKAAFPGRRVHAIESYRSKADFGDLDVLVESRGDDPHAAARALDAVEVVRNGPVTSVGVRVRPEVAALDGNVFQVDLIEIAPEAFEFAARYFSNSDLSNLLGRIAHAQGLKLKHEGLVYRFREGDHCFREIVLTRDYLAALPVLGYDPGRYAQGFEDLDEIFRYVASTPFFNRDIFLLENRNHVARTRDSKRPTYNAFLKWCAARPDLPAFEYPSDKNAWLPRIMAHFPGFEAQHEQAAADLARQREHKRRFNGAFVAALTGLEGRELGRLMQHIQASFPGAQALQDFVLAATPQALEEMVRRAQREMAG